MKTTFSAAAVVFLLVHLPYLPVSLEDVDSINFALGMRQFDVASHQPHPPGYPIFILAAKASGRLVPSEAKALALISVVSAALGILAMAALFRRLFEDDDPASGPLIATLLAATAPLYWFTAARPLSDSFGLAAAVAVQAMILGARTDRAFARAAFCAGLAIGIRSQVAWLTVPLMVWRLAPGTQHPAPRTRTAFIAIAFVLGVLLWFVPLVVVSGGPSAYWRALSAQGAEDLSGIQMLWTTPTPRVFVDALYYAFVAPWAVWPLAAAVLLFAAAGAAVLAMRHRRALALGAVAFGPYFLFDILFQETFTVRYALPLVVPIAWLAAKGIRRLPRPLAIAAVIPMAMYGAHLGGRSIAAYAREPAPVFRALADMRAEAAKATRAPVLAPDRRLSFDLRRPVRWLGAEAPSFDRQLPSPPQHEWLEAVKYWNEGGRAPVWFLVDPRRAAVDLVQHGDPVPYRYAVPYPVLLSGTRPSESNWYRLDRPDWYVGEGWALTPEAAGVAAADGKGLHAGAIHGWARRAAIPTGAFVVGGRNFEPAVQPRLVVSVAGREVVAMPVPSGFFVQAMRLPDDLSTTAEYAPVDIRTDPPARVAIEQFDVSRSRAVLGFGPGWHEPEFNPATGRQWRWLSERGELRYMTAGSPAKLRISGEASRRYYSRASRLVVRAGDRMLADTPVPDDFTIEIDVPAAVGGSTLVVETDQIHVPAERSWRGATDRRHLGLRIYACRLVPSTASSRGTAASFLPGR